MDEVRGPATAARNPLLLHDVATASQLVTATRSRRAKVDAIAAVLSTAAPDEIEIVTSYLAGSLRQRRTGLGWRSLTELPAPADSPTLTVGEVHRTFEQIAALAGAGSQGRRAEAVAELFGRCTASEQEWLHGVVTGSVRQGALDAVVQEAVARAANVPLLAVRRAAMLTGSGVLAAVVAFDGGETALARVGLEVGRPVLPMLASSAPDVAAALVKAGGEEVAVDTKLDGIRIQVHKDGDSIRVVSRSLEDLTARLPEVVAMARALPARRIVLDGEALALDAAGRPRPFQETAARTALTSGDGGVVVTPFFFDVLHLDGTDLLDLPAVERWATLERLVPERHRTPRLVTGDAARAEIFLHQALAAGHEGVVVKSLSAPYDAGRRGSAWVKVKPVLTLDLVVLAVEWGSGRRKGWLSNLHLGARDPESGGFTRLGKALESSRSRTPSGWVPVGKTFKGMTDEMLAWQTARFLDLETDRDGHVVYVRPEQVVEVACDGAQRSTRYPGGVALRFARVVRYRDDKRAGEADTISTLQSLL